MIEYKIFKSFLRNILRLDSSLFRCQKSDKILWKQSEIDFSIENIFFSVKPQECLEEYNVWGCVYKHFDGKSKSNAY